MKPKIYEILITTIIISIIINIYNFNIKKNKTEVIPVSAEPVEENTIDNEQETEQQKPIDSNTTDWNLIFTALGKLTAKHSPSI